MALSSSTLITSESDPVSIRFAVGEDVSAILAIERQEPNAAHWPEEKYRNMLMDEDVQRLVLVVEGQGAVRGFGVAQVVGRECQIENLVIAPDARRQGLGKKLLKGLMEAARERGVRTFSLEVRESNAAARSLYNGCGFEECGIRKRYYQQPEEDGILYHFRCTILTASP